ncbi:zinc finger, CCHC-type containing protein [Tanacetum coccineum]
MGNDPWVLIGLPPGCKWIFKRKLKIYGTIKKFKARLIIQGFRQKLGINSFDTYALVVHISTMRLMIALTSILNLIINQMDLKIDFLNDELDDEIDLKNEFLSSRFFMKDVGDADVILVSTYMDTSEKLGPNNGKVVSQFEYSRVIGCLMYAMTYTRLNKQFSSSIIESEFVALAAASKEAKWLRNMIFEIPLWSKLIAPISIRFDSATTLAKAYSQM